MNQPSKKGWANPLGAKAGSEAVAAQRDTSNTTLSQNMAPAATCCAAAAAAADADEPSAAGSRALSEKF
jgi:hypothetical protein